MTGGVTTVMLAKRFAVFGLAVVLSVSAKPFTSPAAAAPNLTRLAAVVRRSAPVIEPGTVASVSDPGVELTPPVDGRLRADGVALVVTGAALTNRSGQGSQAVSAGPGQHLIVFGLRQIAQPTAPSAPIPVPPSLALVVAGQRSTVSLPAVANNDPAYFVSSVPVGTTVANLELSAAGFSQDFNLMTLTRPGPDPVALYRDPDNPAVATSLDASVNVAAAVATDPGETYTDTITIPTVTLSYFAPTPSADPPPAPDQAYLEIDATEKPVVDQYGEHYVHFSAPIPADRVQLVLPDGTVIAASHVDVAYDDPDDTDYVVAGTYYFVVPADLTAATLKVDAYQGAGFEYIAATGSHQTISLAGFSIPLSLNAPAPVATAVTPATVLTFTNAPSNASSGAGSSVGGGSDGSDAPLWVVLPLLAVLGAAGWGMLRRRRHHPQPVLAGSSAASAYSTAPFPPSVASGPSAAPPRAPAAPGPARRVATPTPVAPPTPAPAPAAQRSGREVSIEPGHRSRPRPERCPAPVLGPRSDRNARPVPHCAGPRGAPHRSGRTAPGVRRRGIRPDRRPGPVEDRAPRTRRPAAPRGRQAAAQGGPSTGVPGDPGGARRSPTTTSAPRWARAATRIPAPIPSAPTCLASAPRSAPTCYPRP